MIKISALQSQRSL